MVAHGVRVSGLTFDGEARLVSSAWDGAVRVWSVPALAALGRLEVRGSANGVAVSPDGAVIAIPTSTRAPQRTPERANRERSGHIDDDPAPLVLWRQGSNPVACAGHGAPVTSVAWAGPDHVLSASWDRSVRLWDARTCAELARLGGYSGPVQNVFIDPKTGQIAVSAWPSGLDGVSLAVLDLLFPRAARAD
jgi:WD40 repeat protein